jgi:hypothetical protein
MTLILTISLSLATRGAAIDAAILLAGIMFQEYFNRRRIIGSHKRRNAKGCLCRFYAGSSEHSPKQFRYICKALGS